MYYEVVHNTGTYEVQPKTFHPPFSISFPALHFLCALSEYVASTCIYVQIIYILAICYRAASVFCALREYVASTCILRSIRTAVCTYGSSR